MGFKIDISRAAWVLLMLVWVGAGHAWAHAPAKTVMYPARTVYNLKGLEVPTLSEGVIALVEGAEILEAEYKTWLFKKVGLTPEVVERFLTIDYLNSVLVSHGADLLRSRKVMEETLYQLETFNQLYASELDWIADSDQFDPTTESRGAVAQQNVQERVDEYYLKTLYLIENWAAVYPAIFEQNGISSDCLDVPGADLRVRHLIQLNNAYYLAKRYDGLLGRYIRSEVYSQGGVVALDDRERHIDWVFDTYQSPLMVENFISMYLVEKRAKETGGQLSHAVVEELTQSRVDQYMEALTRLNESLPHPEVQLPASPEYISYLSRESRVDLLGSRIFRSDRPLKSFEVTKRFYDLYGYQGERCEVLDIFKWVRRRSTAMKDGYDEYVEKEELRLRAELMGLRERIQSEGGVSFPLHAMIENENLAFQNNCGEIGDISNLFGTELSDELNHLPVHEISGVVKSSVNSLHLFWLSEVTPQGRRYFHIARKLPPNAGFDIFAYEAELRADRLELEELMQRIKAGEPFEPLAETLSDSFNKYGSDISEIYQSRYGFSFAHELSDMSEGDLKIITTGKGMHLVQLRGRTVTPFSDEVQAQILDEYMSTIATDDELNELSKELLYEADPFF